MRKPTVLTRWTGKCQRRFADRFLGGDRAAIDSPLESAQPKREVRSQQPALPFLSTNATHRTEAFRNPQLTSHAAAAAYTSSAKKSTTA